MIIGLIADTHHKSEVAFSAINYLKKIGSDYIIHAGDIVEVATLKALKRTKLPYCAVLGNNDTSLVGYKKDFRLFDEPRSEKFGNINIKVMHHPFYFSADHDLVVYGHTHYFSAILSNGRLFINPGEICGRKKPLYEFAYVVYEDRKFSVFAVQSHINEISWHEKKIEL